MPRMRPDRGELVGRAPGRVTEIPRAQHQDPLPAVRGSTCRARALHRRLVDPPLDHDQRLLLARLEPKPLGKRRHHRRRGLASGLGERASDQALALDGSEGDRMEARLVEHGSPQRLDRAPLDVELLDRDARRGARGSEQVGAVARDVPDQRPVGERHGVQSVERDERDLRVPRIARAERDGTVVPFEGRAVGHGPTQQRLDRIVRRDARQADPVRAVDCGDPSVGGVADLFSDHVRRTRRRGHEHVGPFLVAADRDPVVHAQGDRLRCESVVTHGVRHLQNARSLVEDDVPGQDQVLGLVALALTHETGPATSRARLDGHVGEHAGVERPGELPVRPDAAQAAALRLAVPVHQLPAGGLPSQR